MEKQIKQTLDDHERRLSKLELLLTANRGGTSKIKKIPGQGNNVHLTDRIIDLRDNKFFSRPMTAEETHKKLQETYHCELNRVAMALLRLAKRRELRRASKEANGKKYKAYAW